MCNTPDETISIQNVIYLQSVISIASMWSCGIWHFPYEALFALKTLPPDILNNTKIHVSKKTDFILQWLNLINIDSSQIVTGNIFSNKIYLPRMGKCGNPYYSQINWLKDKVNDNVKDIVIKHESLKYVILIKRTNHRVLNNYTQLENELKQFSKDQNLELYIHDDSCLPMVKDQLNIFSKAKYVFASHGAAGINMITMKKDAWYIEFLNNENINVCYARLAYLLNINYIGITIKNLSVEIEKMMDIYKTITSE